LARTPPSSAAPSARTSGLPRARRRSRCATARARSCWRRASFARA